MALRDLDNLLIFVASHVEAAGLLCGINLVRGLRSIEFGCTLLDLLRRCFYLISGVNYSRNLNFFLVSKIFYGYSLRWLDADLLVMRLNPTKSNAIAEKREHLLTLRVNEIIFLSHLLFKSPNVAPLQLKMCIHQRALLLVFLKHECHEICGSLLRFLQHMLVIVQNVAEIDDTSSCRCSLRALPLLLRLRLRLRLRNWL